MSEFDIHCWSCESAVDLDELSCNDGICPHCDAEIDLYDHVKQLIKERDELPDLIAKMDDDELLSLMRTTKVEGNTITRWKDGIDLDEPTGAIRRFASVLLAAVCEKAGS